MIIYTCCQCAEPVEEGSYADTDIREELCLLCEHRQVKASNYAAAEVVKAFKIFIANKLGYTNFNNYDDDWKVRNALTEYDNLPSNLNIL